MDISEVIKGFKEALEKKLSPVTVKNYISDIKHFESWIASKYQSVNLADLLSKNAFDEYIQENSGAKATELSRKSFKRHLSSLRAFSAYLLQNNIISDDPFHKIEEEQAHDVWKISEFKNYLAEKKSGPLTIKYYINDVQSYAKWCNETNLSQAFKENDTPLLDEALISEYARRLQFTRHLSPKSINRKLSSLRNYATFQKIVLGLSIEENNTLAENIPLQPKDSVAIIDITSTQTEESFSKFPPLRLVQRLWRPYLSIEDRIASKISSEVIKTRLNSALKEQKTQPKTALENILRGIHVKNISKEFYAPHELSLNALPLHKKLLHHVKHTRPKWYKTYHNYPFVHYIHFSVVAVFAVFAASFLYNQTLGSAKANSLDLQNLSSMQKTFTFQGKLTDANGDPITTPTDIRLLLYTDPTASGSSLLWQEVQSKVQPAEDGSISLILGSATPVPPSLTNLSEPLYLGVSVGATEELLPRKQLGDSYAQDSGKLFGMLPITRSSKQTNVVLALDGQGNLNIGGNSNHTFAATGGDFTLTGETLILATNPGATGNIVLSPYGNGKIDLQKALISTTGLIQAEGSFEIHATTSASPALSLKQDSAGDLISASTAGSTKFVVNNQGVITKGIWAGEVIGTEFGGFGANISATGPGELLYSTGSKSYGHLAAGKAGECLVSQGRSAPIWNACTILSTLNGAANISNNTLDFVLGGNSTGSAKFAFINMTTSNPILKIGGTLSFSAENGIENNDKDLKLGGNTTKNLIINTSGNVGVKNSSPTRTFDVNGNWGGNVDFYVDGAGNNEITRESKALIYDLEKNTGTTNTTSTTTYNIVGLPDIDGTVALIYTKVEKGITADPQKQTIEIKINGSSIASVTTNDDAVSSGEESDVKHFTAARSNGKWLLIGNSELSSAADLAEWTEYEGVTPLSGMIVKIGESGKLNPSDTEYDPRLAGVISTKPNITIGQKTPTSIKLALSGRIPVLVTSINGDILPGDTITSSMLPGTGMKLSRNGSTVGKALEGFKGNPSCKNVDSISEIVWPADDGKNTAKPCFKTKVSNIDEETKQILLSKYGYSSSDYIYIGKVMMFSNLSWSESQDLLASLNTTSIEDADVNSLMDLDLVTAMQQIQNTHPGVKLGGQLVKKLGVFSEIAVGKIKTGSIIASNIGTNNLVAAGAIIGNLTTNTLRVTDSLFIDGVNIKDYIAYELKNQDKLSSPVATFSTLKTDKILPNKGNDIVVELPSSTDSALVIKNAETNEDVISLNANGNIQAQSASIAGTLASNTLQTNNATVSGTLHADKLVANEITGLDDRLTTIATNLIKQSKPQENTNSQSFDSSISHASVSAGFGTFYEGLLSLGASTFGDLSVMDTLSVGTTLTVSPNSINTLGVDLEIQPLRQGQISFMAGAVKIKIDGSLAVFEDAFFHKNVTIAGNLSAHIISPLPNSDVNIKLPNSSIHNSEFKIQNSSDSAVLAISSDGNLQASGSGTFSKLKFNLVGQAIASGQNQAIATGSAGTAILKKSTNELTIINPNVTKESLIYITPAQETQNLVLYLLRQRDQTENQPGSFTVGISGVATTDILFNWLIVN
ncbi:MAG: site-specific integrase [Candidatus Levybacteria bacterium]|nr:site-specific integrase [Candidatus Levybacteria bacterium]